VFFYKNPPAPPPVRVLKNSAHYHTVIGNWALNSQMRSKAHTALTAPLVLHRTTIYKCAMKKFGINGRLQNNRFLIVIHRFSLVKAAMISLRACKLSKNCLIGKTSAQL
jgi:hypothetical protein